MYNKAFSFLFLALFALLAPGCAMDAAGPADSQSQMASEGTVSPSIPPANCKVVSGVTMCCPEAGMVVSEWQVCRSQAYFGCALAEGGGTCTFLTTDTTQPMSDCPSSMGCGQCMTTGAHGFNQWCGQQR
jgi:hypothetical protein